MSEESRRISRRGSIGELLVLHQFINVQGRRSRHRSPACIADTLRRNYRDLGVDFYFFTDDDFARNPGWREIFSELIGLRETEGIPIEFMIQVDVASHRIPGFVEMAPVAATSSSAWKASIPRASRTRGKPRTKSTTTATSSTPGTRSP